MFSFMFFTLPCADARILQVGSANECVSGWWTTNGKEWYQGCQQKHWTTDALQHWYTVDEEVKWCPTKVDADGYQVGSNTKSCDGDSD